ncbi:unnamed protein product, partial [marine sediment metagenome]
MSVVNPGELARAIITGTYTGNGNMDRQITTGFKCSLVIHMDLVSKKLSAIIPNAALMAAAVMEDIANRIILHDS